MSVSIDDVTALSNPSNESCIPYTDSSESETSVIYDKDNNEKPTDFEEMLTDGLITDDHNEEYLIKLKLLESRLKDKVNTGHFRCKIKPVKVYK